MECLMLLVWQAMPARIQARPDNAAKGGEKRSLRVTRSIRFAIRSFVICILACLPIAAIHAEENAGLTGSPSFAVSLNLATLSSSILTGKDHVVRLAFDSRFSEGLKELAADKELKNVLPKSLLRKRLVWVNEPRTKLRPGFGEFFRGETVEPLRTGGVGMEDSRYLYVKFHFKF
jgi:hypothetical protein